MSVCGCLCVSRIDGSVCPLCLDPVPSEDWQSGKHRSQCGNRNTAKLSIYPPHPSVLCTTCGGKIRLWPAPTSGASAKFRCSSEVGLCATNEHGQKIKNNGKNRYYCYSCDYNLCAGCADKQAVEKSQQEKLVSCLQNLCDKVRDKVEEEAKQMSIDVEDDIPLIDSDTAITNISSEPSPVPTRGSTSIINSISKHIVLPIKPVTKREPCRSQELSPDVFKLRAPIVSLESLVMSPTASSLEMELKKITEAKLSMEEGLEVDGKNEGFSSDGADSDTNHQFHDTQAMVDSSPECENTVLSTNCIVHDIEIKFKNDVMNDNDDSHNNNDGSEFETFSCSEDCHSKLDLISLD